MNLKDLNFSNRLDTSSSDLTEDFFVPALSAAYRYDRGVGFFSSGWIRITSKRFNRICSKWRESSVGHKSYFE